MAEEEEGIGRRPHGLAKNVVPTIAVVWCFFQLSIASWLILDSTFIRAIHLGFALLIVFLNYPLCGDLYCHRLCRADHALWRPHHP
jgi:TRAP-type uncharacterized transport system fused permease subunit